MLGRQQVDVSLAGSIKLMSQFTAGALCCQQQRPGADGTTPLHLVDPRWRCRLRLNRATIGKPRDTGTIHNH